jgi:hypothetical protein
MSLALDIPDQELSFKKTRQLFILKSVDVVLNGNIDDAKI